MVTTLTVGSPETDGGDEEGRGEGEEELLGKEASTRPVSVRVAGGGKGGRVMERGEKRVRERREGGEMGE